ncbi:MAG: RNA polymerase subunit sigma [Sphingobacteriaceae bacterium]|nr:MAG: RNA polymerase subunit sigma [Sphingobacteriaceae bacterium]
MNDQQLIPHLFRSEARKLTAVLCKLLGIDQIDVAEDIVAETFLAALETWPYKGKPQNPTAWLYTVAKNKAKNHVTRNKVFTEKVTPEFINQSITSNEVDIDLSEKNIADSQLQMLFAICNPLITAEAQIGLALRILCGFGIDEIANAFLSNKETINKRLYRAKEKLRAEKVKIEFPAKTEIESKLSTVLTTLYLLYNEGYYSESNDVVLRDELCLEAMRLMYMLIECPPTNTPAVNALFALMCFHASRFEARKNDNGQLVLYHDQDETLWNQELIFKGAYHLHRASSGDTFTKYHLEASIAYWLTNKTDTAEKWDNILQLYNKLLMIEYSPIAALNRTYALAKVKGNTIAIKEAEELNMANNPYYFTLLGELYKPIDPKKAKDNFLAALALAKTAADRQIIQKNVDNL